MSLPVVAVVGGGLAAARTCQELRADGFHGDLVVLAAESAQPYDRPPLSKPGGASAASPPSLGIDLAGIGVQVRTGTAAVALTPMRGSRADSPGTGVSLTTSDGDEVSADAVVIATGAAPILPANWSAVPALRCLRTYSDARWIAASLASRKTSRVTVVGGSWLGAELASLSRGSCEHVRIVEQSAWLLPHLPPEAGRETRTWFADAGIDVRVGLAVDEIASAGADAGAVVVAGDETWEADLVLAALGIRPATTWLAGSDVRLAPHTGAVRVNPGLATNVPGVFGVGDAVERWSPRYSAWLPGGHWQDAMDGPKVVSASIRSWLQRSASRPQALAERRAEAAAGYNAVPYFWSSILGRTLQWTGYLRNYRAEQMIVRRAPAGSGWTMCWLDSEDALLAVLACDRPRDAVAARKLQAATTSGTPRMIPALLGDPEVPIRSAQAGGS